MPDHSAFTIYVAQHDAGLRLDVLIASHIADCSRAVAAGLIRDGKIRIQGAEKKPGYRVKAGDEICGRIPPAKPYKLAPEPIEIDILFEDEHLIIVNKPPGLVVHPAPGHFSGTLVHGLLYHHPQLEDIGAKQRAGIVHRLDKDTTGILVVAKSAGSHQHLSKQFKLRKIQKDYLALVYGEMQSDSGTVSLPLGRHPVDRKRMSTVSRKSRSAETSWQVRERFWGATLLNINIKTGRTHQIRVHCAAIRHPIVGDTVYGARRTRKILSKKNDVSNVLGSVSRQMLHARRLEFLHPATETTVSFESPIPQDLQDVIIALRRAQE